MIIYNNPNSTSFMAKFLYSDSLKDVAKYASEQGKFKYLDEARNNIDSTHLRTRLLFECGENEKGFPFVTFTKYEPKSHITIPQSADDYVKHKPITYTGNSKKISIMEFALKKLITMGNNVPNNKIFRKVVVEKHT